MAKSKKEEGEVTVIGEVSEPKELIVPPDAIIDVAVTVISLEADPYHKDGEEFQMGKKTAEELAKRGWVKIK